MVGLLSIHQATAATIPLDSITLGAVIQINGQNFVKIGDNRYLSVCALETMKCPVDGQIYDENLGRCICRLASSTRQSWTGCNDLEVWEEGVSQLSDVNTVCLLDRYSHKMYQAHKLADGKCYVTSNTSNVLEPVHSVDCPVGQVYYEDLGRCYSVCFPGQDYSEELGGCYTINACDTPTDWLQNWRGCTPDLPAWDAETTADNGGVTVCLADKRDGKTYMVRKLADDKCWMVSNLAYGASDKYDGEDVCRYRTTMTNADSEANIKDKFGGQANSTTAYDLWGDCRGNSGVADSYRDGYYYNWAAAMRQTNTWYGNSNAPTYQTNVQGLCPDGWTLPTRNDFSNLYGSLVGTDAVKRRYFNNNNDGDDSVKYGWHGLYSGNTNNAGGLSNQGSRAYYWSSTFGNANLAYNLFYYSSGVSPEYIDGYKLYGFSIRCFRN